MGGYGEDIEGRGRHESEDYKDGLNRRNYGSVKPRRRLSSRDILVGAMLRRLIFVLLTVMPIMCAAQLPRPVPKDRGALSTGDWFPHVFSKLAPLEEWDVILSADDIRRD